MWAALLNIFLCLGGINAYEDSWGQYMWVPWSGYIPHNALSAGFDEKDRPIYIGRVYERGELFPIQVAIDSQGLPRGYYQDYERPLYNFEIFVPPLNDAKKRITWAHTYDYDATPIIVGMDETRTKDYFVCLVKRQHTAYIGKTFGDNICTITNRYGDLSVRDNFKILSIQY